MTGRGPVRPVRVTPHRSADPSLRNSCAASSRSTTKPAPRCEQPSAGDVRAPAAQQVGEYVRGLATLEAQDRDRAAKFSQMAAAGLAERQVRLADRQGALIEQVLAAVFADIGLTDRQRRAAPEAIRRALSAAS